MPTRPPIHGSANVKAQRDRSRREFDRQRYTRDGRAFYGTTAWQRLREQVLREQPLCVECEAGGRVEPATIADHKIDRADAPHLALERSNVQGLCKHHHDRKTRATVNERLRGRQTGERRTGVPATGTGWPCGTTPGGTSFSGVGFAP